MTACTVPMLRVMRFLDTVAYPGILFGGGGSANSVEDRENGDVGGSGGSRNLVQEISFHIVKFS